MELRALISTAHEQNLNSRAKTSHKHGRQILNSSNKPPVSTLNGSMGGINSQQYDLQNEEEDFEDMNQLQKTSVIEYQYEDYINNPETVISHIPVTFEIIKQYYKCLKRIFSTLYNHNNCFLPNFKTPKLTNGNTSMRKYLKQSATPQIQPQQAFKQQKLFQFGGGTLSNHPQQGYSEQKATNIGTVLLGFPDNLQKSHSPSNQGTRQGQRPMRKPFRHNYRKAQGNQNNINGQSREVKINQIPVNGSTVILQKVLQGNVDTKVTNNSKSDLFHNNRRADQLDNSLVLESAYKNDLQQQYFQTTSYTVQDGSPVSNSKVKKQNEKNQENDLATKPSSGILNQKQQKSLNSLTPIIMNFDTATAAASNTMKPANSKSYFFYNHITNGLSNQQIPQNKQLEQKNLGAGVKQHHLKIPTVAGSNTALSKFGHQNSQIGQDQSPITAYGQGMSPHSKSPPARTGDQSIRAGYNQDLLQFESHSSSDNMNRDVADYKLHFEDEKTFIEQQNVTVKNKNYLKDYQGEPNVKLKLNRKLKKASNQEV